MQNTSPEAPDLTEPKAIMIHLTLTQSAAAERWAATGGPSDKHNMRFKNAMWKEAAKKADRIGTDMTEIARWAYAVFLAETDQQSADRLGTRLATGTPGHVLVHDESGR